MMVQKGLTALLVSAMVMGLTACGSNMESNGDFVESVGQKAEVNQEFVNDLKAPEVETAVPVPEKVVSILEEINSEDLLNGEIERELDKQLKKLKVLKVLSFLLSIPFKPGTEPVEEKIKNPFKEFTRGVLKVVDKAYKLDDKLISQIDEVISQLDPQVESHQKVLERVDHFSDQVGSYQDKLDEIMVKFIGGVDNVIAKIKTKRATSVLNPLVLIAASAAIKYFEDFRSDLEAYIVAE